MPQTTDRTTDRTTDQLIHRLTQDASPVHRLSPPVVRAAIWLATVAALAALGIVMLADVAEFAARAADKRQMIELAATFATGLLAVVAAFEMSLPDRARAWALLPMPALAIWIASAGTGCVENWIAGVPSDLAESADCFAIIVGTSVPLGLGLLWMLRRAKPLAPAPVAAMGGLGVAGIAAFLLQFFHPFDVTVIDLAIHAVAVGLVVGVCALGSRRALA